MMAKIELNCNIKYLVTLGFSRVPLEIFKTSVKKNTYLSSFD